MGKDLEKSRRFLTEVFASFAWSDWDKQPKATVKAAGFPSVNQSHYLMNASLERYSYANLLEIRT
jgi:hypothetical protein